MSKIQQIQYAVVNNSAPVSASKAYISGFNKEGQEFILIGNLKDEHRWPLIRKLEKVIPIEELATYKSFKEVTDANCLRDGDETKLLYPVFEYDRNLTSLWLSTKSIYSRAEAFRVIERLMVDVRESKVVAINLIRKESDELVRNAKTVDDLPAIEAKFKERFNAVKIIFNTENVLRTLMMRVSEYLNCSNTETMTLGNKIRLIRSKALIMAVGCTKEDVNDLIVKNLTAPEVILTQLILAKHFGKLEHILSDEEFDYLYNYIREIQVEWEAGLDDLKCPGKKPYCLEVKAKA